MLLLLGLVTRMLSVSVLYRNYSLRWAVTSISYRAADIFVVRNEKLFSAICMWTNHCIHHLLPSERDTGHNLRHGGHSYQLVCYNFSSTRRCFVIRMLYDSL